MDLGLKGKRALVTGGSRGIGKACAIELARESCDVCIVGRDETLLNAAMREVFAFGVRGGGVSADLRTQEGCEIAVESCVKALGAVDILVNSAGAATLGPILELPIAAVEDALALKTYGYLRLSQLVAPHMREQGWGRIVNIAGGAGASPNAWNIPTSLANAGVLNVTRALSDALSADGILVNTICPGLTNTDRARDMARLRAQQQGRDIDEVLTEMAKDVPAKRMAEPDEIARVAVFLASEACSYVHGSSIYMDGGGRRGTP